MKRKCTTTYCERLLHANAIMDTCKPCIKALCALRAKSDDELDESERRAMLIISRIKSVRIRRRTTALRLAG